MNSFKLVTWNVNSIRIRLDALNVLIALKSDNNLVGALKLSSNF